MKTLLVALYQRYSTTVSPEFRSLSPTATSRFELVYDDSYPVAEVGLSRLLADALLIPSRTKSAASNLKDVDLASLFCVAIYYL